MVGCGSLSDCGEECEVQLSASGPPALTLCVSDHRLSPSHYDKLHIASLSQCSGNVTKPKKQLPNFSKKKLGAVIKADIPLKTLHLSLTELLLALFTQSRASAVDLLRYFVSRFH